MTRNQTSSHRGSKAVLALIALIALNGCQQAPSFNIAGSFFPGWIFCSVTGIVAAGLAHGLFVRLKLERDIQPPVLIYPCIALSCAVTLWLLFFS
jgi:hypothetical protein